MAAFDIWLADDGARLREWLTGQTPDWLHGLIATLPLWAAGALGVVAALASVWVVIQIVQGAIALLRFLWGLVTRPVTTARDTFVPETKAARKDVEKLKADLAAEKAENARRQEEILARLDALQRLQVAAGADPLGAEERGRRDAAVAEIVAEASPAADAAAEKLAAGDLAGAIATLERDARADAEAAAEKWRRLGALVLGVDFAKAKAAYEEAFRLQPDDFWTCVELARLRQTGGDLAGARLAAEAAARSAATEREKSVAADALGDVLREGGDLSGARAQYEAGLKVSERLARDNPASAEAQRDLSISYERLGDVLAASGDRAGAIARYRQSLPIAEALAQANPSHPGLQKDAAITRARLAELEGRV
ncbi:hypothetical protein [Hyphomonas sp.]|uniref:hypothetical protein n=1 Tax=Hyphomonas sp. TaxID=87 RepID=UPI00391BB102